MNSKGLKILYVITKSDFGGAQRYIYDMATHMQAKGHAVTVAIGGTGAKSAEGGKLLNWLQEKQIRTLFIKHFMRDMNLWSDIGAIFELISIVRAERPDVLHVTSSKAGGLGAFAGRVCGVKRIVFTSHGLAYNETWRPFWQRLLIKYSTWFTMSLAHMSIMISKETYELARALPFLKHKVALIYNGIETPKFIDRDEARKELQSLSAHTIHADSFWVGTIAELHPNKNLSVAIDAIRDMRTHGNLASLVVISDGEERAELTKQAKELDIQNQIHLVGYVPNASRLLKAFDTFILPSKKEGLPYVLLEAGLAELPVIASNISGNNDIIEHNETGLLIEANGHTLSKELERYMHNSKLAKKHALALKRQTETTFSIENMVRETQKLYKS